MRLLTQRELARVTGCREPGRQMAVLRQAGIWPIVRSDGRLVVAEEAILAAMQSGKTTAPDFSALEKA